ncbi:ATP-binding cassette domain-containing protein [Catenovulum sp. 2E275]|uniref:ABC transporter ATP-binding protein n=1 Tax=Catenovulum sp. 2E275 TaxID=2980497 RepID=UPI0021D182D2|nr:ATP-binding cassette domain-containing protein [Catenovulum sp. 2E275]MCU4674597.1 ATP-binding cassette domain-containing protein [Catenovulum sp. 2E275]
MLKLTQITKRFNLKQAAKLKQNSAQDSRIKGRFFYSLNDISLNCEPGEVLGLLGANGAGKTTLLRVLSTALTANQGEFEFNGVSVKTALNQYRKQVGFLSGTTGLYERLTGYENLLYFARLYGLSQIEAENRIATLAELLALNEFINRRLADYSTGMKQRVAIARSVLHSPKLLILDEPTTGLDIAAKEVILTFIETMQAQGICIIFSTHDMAEVERLCQRVCIIDKGQQKFIGGIDELKQQTNAAYLQQALLSLMQSQ